MEHFIKSVKSFFVHKKENEKSAILPFIRKNSISTNINVLSASKCIESNQEQQNIANKNVDTSNDNCGCCQVRLSITNLPQLLLFRLPSFLTPSPPCAAADGPIARVVVNKDLHTALAEMWQQLRTTQKAKFTTNEMDALKSLFERELEATETKLGTDVIVDMQIAYGKSKVEENDGKSSFINVCTTCSLDISDKFQLFYLAPPMGNSELHRQLAVHHLAAQPILEIPAGGATGHHFANVLICLCVLAQLPASCWSGHLAFPGFLENLWENVLCILFAQMIAFACFLCFFFGKNIECIYKLATVRPKKAAQIQKQRLLLFTPFLLALGAIPALKFILDHYQLELLENDDKIIKTCTIIYHLLLLSVPGVLEMCIHATSLAKYQRQMERAKANANEEDDQQLAQHAKEVLLRLSLNNNGHGCHWHGYGDAKLLRELFQN